jgi:hypothetical protein
MKTILLSCGIGFFVAAIAFGASGQIAKAAKKTFFQGTLRETIASILPSLDPESETSLTANENSRLVTVFSWWLNRLLEPTYVPSMDFVTQNIQLYPANKQHSEDIAALSFDIEGDHYQVIQTYERFCVLMESGKATATDADHAKTNVEGLMNAMLRCKMIKTPGKVTLAKLGTVNLVSTNGAYVGKADLDGVPVKCLTNGKEICISFPKWQFEETVAAHVPMPNEWFSWERGKVRPRNTK